MKITDSQHWLNAENICTIIGRGVGLAQYLRL